MQLKSLNIKLNTKTTRMRNSIIERMKALLEKFIILEQPNPASEMVLVYVKRNDGYSR